MVNGSSILERLNGGGVIHRVLGNAYRSLEPRTVLGSFGSVHASVINVSEEILCSFSHGSDDFPELEFFRLNREVGNDALANEYDKRGLVPADLYSLVALNREKIRKDRRFCWHFRNATLLKSPLDNKWYALTFFKWGDENRCMIRPSSRKWRPDWNYAGIRVSCGNG